MQIIVNEAKRSHLSHLRQLIRNSTQILISVAFLKASGLSLVLRDMKIALARGAKIKILCGRNFYLTEPDALRTLHKLFSGKSGCELFLYRGKKRTFHPKLYCFVHGNRAHILVGSANFTEGGFRDNVEASLIIDVPIESNIFERFSTYFEILTEPQDALHVTDLRISQYEREYTISHKHHKRAENESKREINALKRLEIDKIEKYVQRYLRNNDEQTNFRLRLFNYRKARTILEKISSRKLKSKREFMKYYEQLVGKAGFGHLWHSDGLFRRKADVAARHADFIRMVRDVRRNLSKRPEIVFRIGQKYTNRIHGLGPNVLTEVMNTYEPRKFAVLNNNPLTALEFFGFTEFPSPGSFTPQTYAIFNALIADLMKICNFKTMGRVDHFLNYIYWRHAKKY